MIYYNEEDWFEVLPDLKPLFEETNDEVGPYPEQPFDVDFDMYDTLAEAGKLAIFTARDDEELIGYGVFMLDDTHNYHIGMRHACSDVIYVKPEYRGQVAAQFIEDMDDRLVADYEVDGIAIQVNVTRDFSGLLSTLGYEKRSYVCTKYLGQ